MESFNADLQGVIRLVEALYSSRDPNEVLQIQKQLQNIQKSPSGWEIADALLSVDSINCKFFGALTYTVKINVHSDEIDGDRAMLIITRLLAHVISNVSLDSSNISFLVRKLLSNLALMYIKHEGWTDPLTSLAVSLLEQTPVLSWSNEPLPNISTNVVQLVLLFSQIIVEEVLRDELRSSTRLYESIYSKVFPITSNLLFTNQLYLQSLECLSSWIQYVATAEYNSPERYDMSHCLNLLLDLVVSEDTSISSKAILVVVDTLETKTSFFNKELRLKIERVIFSEFAVEYLKNSKEIDDFENINGFSRLVTTYLETDVINFAASILQDSSSKKYDFLLSLTDFPANPIDEELVSKDLLEFWSELAEAFIEDTERLSIILRHDAESLLHLNSKILDVFNKVCFIYWKKIHIPRDDFKSYKVPFSSYRRDVVDFFDLAYPIVKVPFYEFLVQNVLLNLSEQNLNFGDIEASLYVLNSISASFSENNVNMVILRNLGELMESPMLQVFSSRITDAGSSYAINTLIQFLSGIDFFYKHKSGLKYVSSILNFLFECIIQIPKYRLSASKAVSKIADDCRLSLIDYLDNFETILNEMIAEATVGGIVRERITNAYASIVQGTKNAEAQGQHLNNYLRIVQQKIFSLSEANATQDPETMNYLVSLLNCVSELGKGMQQPDDIDDYFSELETEQMNEYWSKDPLQIHQTIISIINKVCLDSSQLSLVQSSEVLEKCCLIIRRGLTETVPGAFTLDTSIVLEFIVAKIPLCSTNSFPLLFKLMESVIVSGYLQLTPEIVSGPIHSLFYQHVDRIKDDTDLMESSISMVATILERKPKLVFNNEFSQVLELCLMALDTKEKFILKASSRFWSRLIVLKKGDQADHEFITNLFINENLGMILTLRTLLNLLQALRSNIDNYQEILKFLVPKYPLQVKNWFINSFVEISNIRSNQNLKPISNSDLFIKKMMATRGKGHLFSTVVKDFWLEVNGLTSY